MNCTTQMLSYPEGYPFEYLLDFVAFFSNHQKDKAALVELQAMQKLPQLIQPAPTRWGTLLQCFQSLKESEHVLHQMVSAREFNSGTALQKAKQQSIKDIICNELFPMNLEKSIQILLPIQLGNIMFQSDTISLSEVYHHFVITMKDNYSTMISLHTNEKVYISQRVKSRLDFMYGEAIGLSYLLDPKYLGERMDAEHKLQAQDYLHQSGSVGLIATNKDNQEQQQSK